MSSQVGFFDVFYNGSCLDKLEWWLHLKGVGRRWKLSSSYTLQELPTHRHQYHWQKIALNIFLVFTYIIAAPLTLLGLALRGLRRCCLNTEMEVAENKAAMMEEWGPAPIQIEETVETPIRTQDKASVKRKVKLKILNRSFPEKEEAKKIVSQRDLFLNSLTPYDFQVRLGREASLEEYIDFYQNQILEWSEEEKAAIQADIGKIWPKLLELKVNWPKKLHFIKTIGKEEIEGTFAYCRRDAIVFCGSYHPDLLAHELFHTLSQCNPDKRDQLYQMLGFQKVSGEVVFPKNRVLNPDFAFEPYSIEIEHEGQKVRGVPIDIIPADKKPTYLNLEHYLLPEDGRLIPYTTNDSYLKQVGLNTKGTTYNESPEEILAENFAFWVKGKTVPTQEIQDKMLAILRADAGGNETT